MEKALKTSADETVLTLFKIKMPSLKARDNPHRADNNDTRNPAGAEDSSEEKDMRNLKNIKMRRGEERRGEERE